MSKHNARARISRCVYREATTTSGGSLAQTAAERKFPIRVRVAMRRLIETAVTEQQVASIAGYVDTNTLHNHIGMGNRSEIANRAL